MMENRHIIVLVGMMGSGKSTIAASLSRFLQIPFYDSDAEIEIAQKKSVKKIFRDDGEVFFRKLEEEVILQIIKINNPCVLSIGGGAFMNENIRNSIKQNTVSIWINCDIDILIERMRNSRWKRPLISTGDIDEKMRKIFHERKDVYNLCDIRIDYASETQQELMQMIIVEIKKFLNINN